MSWLKVNKMIKKKANGKPFVIGQGNKNAKTMIVRDMFGEKKNIIHQVLSQLGVKLEDVYITQVCKIKTVKISEKDIARWLPVLQEEVKLVKPEEIVALGKAAKIAFFDGKLVVMPYKKVVSLKVSFIARLEKLWKGKLKPIIGG